MPSLASFHIIQAPRQLLTVACLVAGHMAEVYGPSSGLLFAGVCNITAGLILVPVIVTRLVKRRSAQSMVLKAMVVDKVGSKLY